MNEQIGNKINDKTYIKLTPFKGFVLENFPFIEADFDAITNYQLLCKVIEYLNNVIANQNTVQELGTDLVNAYNSLVDAVNLAINEFETDITGDFNDLKNYVDNYFDNNFPQLISDKLDEMAEDGTLENLLNDVAHLTKSYNTYTEMMADSSTFTNGLRLKTYGYYAINDGGDAEYFVNNQAISDNYQINLQNGLYLNLITRNNLYNVKQFGAKGDGINDDTTYIQTAINKLKDNTSLYFPKGINSNYLITDTLVLSANNVSVFSEPKSEYSTSITCNTANKTIMLITGYGVTFKNLSFMGNGSQQNFSSVNGITFDRTSLGDDETYSNIDCVVEDCLFFRLNDCLTIKGRNARIKNNTFTESKNGVIGLLHKYNSNTETSEFRGFYIVENVFHSMNFQNNSLTGSTLDTLNSVCIKMPIESNKVGNLQVLDNKVEFCNSIFYKGYLTCIQISNNNLYFSLPTLIYSPNNDSDLQSRSNSFTALINGNYVRGIANTAFTDTFIYVKNTNNVKISNNNFRECNGDAIINDGCGRMVITNNFIQSYGTNQNSGILFESVGNGAIKDNVINSFKNTNYGITSSNNVDLSNNTITGVATAINVNAQYIGNSIIKTDYQLPTLQNNFTYYDTYTQGITKYDIGLKEITIALQNGTQNGTAFVLPAGYRPSQSFTIPCIVLSPHITLKAYAFIGSTGEVKVNWGSGTPDSDVIYIIKTIYL